MTGFVRNFRREGLLEWIPLGGVDDTGSSTEGGSSGSGGGGKDIPVSGERRSVCPMKGLRSSSPSGGGAGSGRGLALGSDLLGAADKPPPTRGLLD